MTTDTIRTREDQVAGDLIVKRKLDTVQIIREPGVVLSTLTAEDAYKLAQELLDAADKILKATGTIE